MNNQQSQGQPMSPDAAKASLGLATHLQSLLMPQAQPDTSQQPNPAPEPPTNQETSQDLTAEIQGLESRIMDEIGVLKSEIQKAQPKDSGHELETLKKEIEKIINE